MDELTTLQFRVVGYVAAGIAGVLVLSYTAHTYLHTDDDSIGARWAWWSLGPHAIVAPWHHAIVVPWQRHRPTGHASHSPASPPPTSPPPTSHPPTSPAGEATVPLAMLMDQKEHSVLMTLREPRPPTPETGSSAVAPAAAAGVKKEYSAGFSEGRGVIRIKLHCSER